MESSMKDESSDWDISNHDIHHHEKYENRIKTWKDAVSNQLTAIQYNHPSTLVSIITHLKVFEEAGALYSSIFMWDASICTVCSSMVIKLLLEISWVDLQSYYDEVNQLCSMLEQSIAINPSSSVLFSEFLLHILFLYQFPTMQVVPPKNQQVQLENKLSSYHILLKTLQYCILSGRNIFSELWNPFFAYFDEMIQLTLASSSSLLAGRIFLIEQITSFLILDRRVYEPKVIHSITALVVGIANTDDSHSSSSSSSYSQLINSLWFDLPYFKETVYRCKQAEYQLQQSLYTHPKRSSSSGSGSSSGNKRHNSVSYWNELVLNMQMKDLIQPSSMKLDVQPWIWTIGSNSHHRKDLQSIVDKIHAYNNSILTYSKQDNSLYSSNSSSSKTKKLITNRSTILIRLFCSLLPNHEQQLQLQLSTSSSPSLLADSTLSLGSSSPSSSSSSISSYRWKAGIAIFDHLLTLASNDGLLLSADQTTSSNVTEKQGIHTPAAKACFIFLFPTIYPMYFTYIRHLLQVLEMHIQSTLNTLTAATSKDSSNRVARKRLQGLVKLITLFASHLIHPSSSTAHTAATLVAATASTDYQQHSHRYRDQIISILDMLLASFLSLSSSNKKIYSSRNSSKDGKSKKIQQMLVDSIVYILLHNVEFLSSSCCNDDDDTSVIVYDKLIYWLTSIVSSVDHSYLLYFHLFLLPFIRSSASSNDYGKHDALITQITNLLQDNTAATSITSTEKDEQNATFTDLSYDLTQEPILPNFFSPWQPYDKQALQHRSHDHQNDSGSSSKRKRMQVDIIHDSTTFITLQKSDDKKQRQTKEEEDDVHLTADKITLPNPHDLTYAMLLHLWQLQQHQPKPQQTPLPSYLQYQSGNNSSSSCGKRRRRQSHLPQTTRNLITNQLPEELLLTIFSYFSYKSLVQVSNVCQTFYRLIYCQRQTSHSLWQTLFYRTFPSCIFLEEIDYYPAGKLLELPAYRQCQLVIGQQSSRSSKLKSAADKQQQIKPDSNEQAADNGNTMLLPTQYPEACESCQRVIEQGKALQPCYHRCMHHQWLLLFQQRVEAARRMKRRYSTAVKLCPIVGCVKEIYLNRKTVMDHLLTHKRTMTVKQKAKMLFVVK